MMMNGGSESDCNDNHGADEEHRLSQASSTTSTPCIKQRKTHGRSAPNTPSTRPKQVRLKDKEFNVFPMTRDFREANDTIHNVIHIEPAVQTVLDTPPVQRLANLKQLGCAFNTYPCCTHTRKEHSLGVMELAGRMVSNLSSKQPKLNITAKDILCIRLAGLCHDLGHGPFSHGYEAFLEAVRKNETENPDQYKDRNDRFVQEFGVDIPQLPSRYEHEETSLVMIDSLLASIGLEIDLSNLDEPLKQIGGGIDSKQFGTVYEWNGKIDTPFTSRDWVFIKEAIYGGALPKSHAPSGQGQSDFVGRPREKEFLYDIVNNRHNGLDVDKIDYFERDGRASKTNESNNLKFLTDSFVGRGRYQGIGIDEEQEFLMICYPHKMISPANQFFQTRKRNHEAIYTHKKTKAAELQMVDLLLEADKHFSMLMSTQLDDPSAFPVPSSFDDFCYERLPISRAWMHPNLFLRTDDTIVSLIENMAISSGNPLGRLRRLINDRRMHRMYKSVFEVELGELDDDLWGQSEDVIANELMLEQTLAQSMRGHKGSGDEGQLNGDQKQQVLTRADFIVDKREIHCGRKAQNPVAQMRFLKNKADKVSLHGSPDKLPLCGELETVPLDTPRSFLR